MHLLVLMTIIVMSSEVKCQQSDLSSALSRLIRSKKRMNNHMVSMKNNVNRMDSLTTFIEILKDLKKKTEMFMESNRETPQTRPSLNMLKTTIEQDEVKYGTSDPLMASFTLSHNNERRAFTLLTLIRQSIIMTSSFSFKSMCNSLKAYKHPDPRRLTDLKDISPTNICRDVLTCPASNTLYSNKRYQVSDSQGHKRFRINFGHGGYPSTYTPPRPKKPQISQEEMRLRLKYKEQDISSACTNDKQCNINQALPMMAGVLKFQINEMIYQKMCPENCDGGKCNYQNAYKKAVEDINRLIGFAASLPSYWKPKWKTFYQEAVDTRAFTDLDLALSMVEKRKDDFLISSFQCYLVRFAPSCNNGDVYKQFRLFRKMQESRKSKAKVKDLRLYSAMDHTEMIKLQKDDVKHVELLGSIRMLNDNLEASVAGISQHFEGLAKFDVGIAANDIASIQIDLDQFEKSLSDVQTKLSSDIQEAMKLMIGVVSANLAEEAAKLAVLIAQNSNPLKLIFTGPDVSDVIDQTGSVANAATDVVKGTALFIGMTQLAQDSVKLIQAFGGNFKQITSLTRVVTKIRSGHGDDVGEDAMLFVDEYGKYTPKTDRSSLAKNDALWSSFTGAICDLLNGDVGIGGAIPKSIAGGKLLCERLEGTLAQYFTLREDIFDFQFQLVDQLALIIRGNVAKRFATKIQGKHDTLEASQFMTGFFLMQYKIQTVASVYCDVLEYKQLGNPMRPCATTDGIFRQEHIKSLISYTDQIPHDEIERHVYIPTRAISKGDTGIIDLQALARGEKVIFKIRDDLLWMKKNRWLLPGETTVPFIKSLKVFLPKRKYENRESQKLLTTQVTVTSVAGSSVSIANPNNRTVYILPNAQNTYRTIYEEGYSSCSSEIDNPYSLCNNLPKICDMTRRMPGQGLLPTILSTFSLQVNISQGIEMIEYNAPNPETPLLVRAKVILQMPFGVDKRSKIPELVRRSDIVMSSNGCCIGNRYRVSLYDRKCGACPQNTTSLQGGLFCQIDETPVS